jgi:hypothetical protein
MAPKEMAAVLRSRNQLYYCVCFFTLFLTYFVHNVSATVCYDRKELVDIRTAFTHPILDEYFSSTSRTGGIYFRRLTRPSSRSFTGERDRGIEDEGPGAL